MNQRLFRETIINIWGWLQGQEEFEPDISAYGVYFIEPTSFKDSIPTIRKCHRLQDFPWPESRCIIICKSGHDILPTIERNLAFIYDSAAAPFSTIIDCSHQLVIDEEHKSDDIIVDPVHDLRFRRSIGRRVYRFELERRQARESFNFDSCDWNCPQYSFDNEEFHGCSDLERENILRKSVVFDSEHWLFKEINDEKVDEDYDYQLTAGYLHHLTPMISPTGYKVAIRQEPFGPQMLRKSFVGKPIFSMLNYERLYCLYRQAKPLEEGEVERHVAPHHRRSHARHLWRKSGLRLEDLPRRAFDRELLVAERNVPVITVREAWIGDRCFSLDGMEYEIQEDEP